MGGSKALQHVRWNLFIAIAIKYNTSLILKLNRGEAIIKVCLETPFSKSRIILKFAKQSIYWFLHDTSFH